MKKLIALLLACALVLSLVACGGSGSSDNSGGSSDGTASVSADDIEDTMTSDDGTYEVAFVTDVGSLKDKSFNEGTWNGVKLYAYENDLSYKYYQPANESEATDDDRIDAMDMYNQRLIQCRLPNGTEKCLKYRLSADFASLPEALFFCAVQPAT